MGLSVPGQRGGRGTRPRPAGAAWWAARPALLEGGAASTGRAGASSYYDGTIFHRNIKGFMVQGGDPTGTGKGVASIWGGKFADEFRESLKHNARGVMSMANSGANTNGSQFFITYAKHQPHLNGHYIIFAKVIHGFDVLDLKEKA